MARRSIFLLDRTVWKLGHTSKSAEDHIFCPCQGLPIFWSYEINWGCALAIHQTELRVRYADTDQGGVVYNSNYLIFFEVGRTEMMRELGVPYAQLEAEGTIMPVVEAHVSYKAPARYDDRLRIESQITAAKKVRLKIETRVVHAESGRLLAEGWVWLATIDAQGNVKRLPREIEKVANL